MSEQVHNVSSLPVPTSRWKTVLYAAAVTTLIAVGASAVRQGWMKNSESDENVDTTPAA